MIEFTTLLKIIGLSFVITKFDPLQWILESIQSWFKPRIFTNMIFAVIQTITTCFSCCSLWVGFVLGGFWYGISAYMIAFVYIKNLSSWEHKIKVPSYPNLEEEIKNNLQNVKEENR